MNLTPIQKYKVPIYGDINYREKCPHESAEQISFLALLRDKYPDLGEIAVHIRNEGRRTKLQAHNEKLQGLNTGASDIVIPCTPPILIELKRRDHTKSSTNQKQLDYLRNAIKLGAFACYALGAVAAMGAVDEWHTINGKK